jgi:hypothetical protein
MSHATAQKVEAGSQFDAKKEPEPKLGPRPISREPVIPVEATKADKKTPTDNEYAQHYVDAVEHRNKAKAARDTPRGNSERTEKTPKGIQLDDPFTLPANIQRIEVGQGRAVVVQ